MQLRGGHVVGVVVGVVLGLVLGVQLAAHTLPAPDASRNNHGLRDTPAHQQGQMPTGLGAEPEPAPVAVATPRFLRDGFAETPGYEAKMSEGDRAAFDSVRYWEGRYQHKAGASGKGSYGQPAEYKARVINAFVHLNGIDSVVEFGVGDGEQLAMANYSRYLGLDVAPTTIANVQRRFRGDASKSFLLYQTLGVQPGFLAQRFDLGLSLDVVYHLTEDTVFEAYFAHLFAAARRYVVVYGWNSPDIPAYMFEGDRVQAMPGVAHVRHRHFVPYLLARFPAWRLVNALSGPCEGKDMYFFQNTRP